MYPNPLIAGFNPDPSCVLVDGTYWTVTSSFEYLPALPVYRSEDLNHWEHAGNVAPSGDQVGLGSTVSGFGVWAPTIRYHRGRFYVIVIVTESTRQCVLFTSEDPTLGWSDGLDIQGIDGIDPDLAWDHDGNAYVTYSALRMLDPAGWSHHGIEQVRVDLATAKTLEAPRTLWSGTGLTAPEGPRIFEREGHWYLLIAEGGTGRGHAVSVARGPSIEGPFTGAPHNPILTASGSDRQVVSTGHGDIITAPDGSDALILLGTRTVDAVGSFSPIGRETFITPVQWVDGWPQASPVQLNPSHSGVEETFTFASPEELQDAGWLAVNRSPQEFATVLENAQGLTIAAESNGMSAHRPSFIGRRQRHFQCQIETKVHTSAGAGGLALRWDEHSWLTLVASPTATGCEITATAKAPSLSTIWHWHVPSSEADLRIQITEPERGEAPWSGGADRIKLSAKSGDDDWHQITDVDGRFWSVEAATGFTGRIIGLLAEAGNPTFSRFSYRGSGKS